MGSAESWPATGRWQGVVQSLHVVSGGGLPMLTVDEVRAVEDRGLEGDRYFGGTGTFSTRPGTGRNVTLIELDALQALLPEYGIDLAPADARRNVVTSGVPLNHLLGCEFRIGDVVLRGMRLCEPCPHLAQLTEAGVLAGLVHRGGLRADILRGGVLKVGDSITPGDDELENAR